MKFKGRARQGVADEAFIFMRVAYLEVVTNIWANNVEFFNSEDILSNQFWEGMQKIVLGSRRRWPLVDWWLWLQG